MTHLHGLVVCFIGAVLIAIAATTFNQVPAGLAIGAAWGLGCAFACGTWGEAS